MTVIYTGKEKWTLINGSWRIARNKAQKEMRVCKRFSCTNKFQRHFYSDRREEKRYCGHQCANLCRKKETK